MMTRTSRWSSGQVAFDASGLGSPVNPAGGERTGEVELAMIEAVTGAVGQPVELTHWYPKANSAAACTTHMGAGGQFQFDVEAGRVSIRVPIPVPVAYYSFGGWKASSFGDTEMYGPEGVNFFACGKVVTSRRSDPATSTVDLGFPRTR